MGRDRIKNALSTRKLDRPAVAAWRHFPQDDQDPRALAESTIRFQLEYDWDFVKVTPSQSYLAELWGARSVYRGDPLGIREFVVRPVNSLGDWKEVVRASPTVALHSVSSYVEAVSRVRDGLGDEAVILATVFSPLSIARYIAGEELFLASVRRVPSDVQCFTDIAADVVTDVIERLVAAGADGSFISLFSAGSSQFGEAEYRSAAEETDRRVFDAAQIGWFNIAHFHAPYPLLNVANDYRVEAVSWDCHQGSPSVEEAGRLCPDKVLIGGIDQRGWLLTEEPTMVEERVRRLVDTTFPTESARLIVAPGCTVSQATPQGNLRALRHGVEPREPLAPR